MSDLSGIVNEQRATIAARAARIAELEALAFAVGQCSPEDVPSAVYQAWSEPANYREG